MHAFVVSYSLRDATPSEHSELCEQLAPAVASVGGLASATWLTNPATERYGAFFVFETKPDFDRFVASELFATISSHNSIHDLKAADYSISDRPTAVTRGRSSSGPERSSQCVYSAATSSTSERRSAG